MIKNALLTKLIMLLSFLIGLTIANFFLNIFLIYYMLRLSKKFLTMKEKLIQVGLIIAALVVYDKFIKSKVM